MKTGDEFLFWTSLTVNGLQAFCLLKINCFLLICLLFYRFSIISDSKFDLVACNYMKLIHHRLDVPICRLLHILYLAPTYPNHQFLHHSLNNDYR